MPQKNKGFDLSRAADIAICAAAVVAAAWLFAQRILGVLSPFIFAWLISLAARPLSRKLCKKTGIPQKLWAALLIIAAVAGVCAAVVFGVIRAAEELTHLLSKFTSGDGEVGDMFFTLGDALGNITKYLPIPNEIRNSPKLLEFWERLDTALENSLMNTVSTLCERIPAVAVNIASALPSIFVFATVSLLSAYYFSVSRLSVTEWAVSALGGESSAAGGWLARGRARVSHGAKMYARAYLLLMLLTFAEMFVGFCAIGVQYAFLLAWVVAFVDFLPILGAGTVLVPWAIISFLSGDAARGAGLLIIFGVSLIVRQIAEPKIVGASLGLHPFASLAALYVGFKLFGILGMILAPAVVMIVFSSKNKTEEE